jgi:hypothetical protein
MRLKQKKKAEILSLFERGEGKKWNYAGKKRNKRIKGDYAKRK